jgi:transcription antitermination factor NusG
VTGRFSVGQRVEIRETGPFHGKRGQVTEVHPYFLAVDLDDSPSMATVPRLHAQRVYYD